MEYNLAMNKLHELQVQGQILNEVVSEDDRNNPLETKSSVGYNLGLTFKEGK